MLDINEKYLANLTVEGEATKDSISQVEQALGIALPSEYNTFIEKHNGVEGGIGENSYLQLWPVEELFEANEGYHVNKFAPGLVLIGSDGGDMAYAYDTRDKSMPIVEVPFIPMRLKEVSFCAKDLAGFFEYLYNQ